MKLTQNYIKICLDNYLKESVLINTLYGFVDILSESEEKVFSKWEKCDNILPCNEDEEVLLSQLLNKKYIYDELQENEYKDNLVEKLELKHKKKLENMHSATFVLTYDCNFSCPYCFEKDNNNLSKIITEDMVDKIFELHNNQIENITLFGGEPLLLTNKNIINYIIAKGKFSTYYVITNGYYLEEYFDILSKSKIGYIQVTLDGTEHEHNKYRTLKNGKDTYSKILKGIELFLKNNYKVRIRMNISKDNVEYYLKARDELRDIFKSYEDNLFFELQPIFQMENKNRDEINNELISTDFSDADYKIKNLHSNTIISLYPGLLGSIIKGVPMQPKFCSCDADMNGYIYDSNGDIYLCLLAVGQKNKSIGEYFPKYFIRENTMLNRTIKTIKECSNCKYALLCGGGCAYAAINKNGDIYKPYCKTFLSELYNTKHLLSVRNGKDSYNE